MKLTILVGFASSGKSTYRARELSKNDKIVVISLDDIRFKILDERYHEEYVKGTSFKLEIEDEVNAIALAQYKQALENKSDIIYDATNLTRAKRSKISSLAKQYNYKIHIHEFLCTIEECMKRQEKRTRKVSLEVMLNMKKIRESVIESEYDIYSCEN